MLVVTLPKPFNPQKTDFRYAGGIAKRKGAFGRVDLVKNSQSSPALTAAAMAPPPMIMPTLAPIDVPAPMMSDAGNAIF